MEKKDKPLPRPPLRTAGQRQEEEQQLLSDRMAAAIAEGRLEAFLKEELPDSEHARALAKMMLGMSGMTPLEIAGAGARGDAAAEERPQEQEAAAPPEEVLRAVRSGNVQDVMELLKREHRKRTGEPEESEAQETTESTGVSPEEQETLSGLVQIAQENRVSLDWVVLRALKLYIQEFRRTGRL